MKWTFKHRDGTKSTVEASDEETARTLAMRVKWGPETGIYLPEYRGIGLDLIGESR